MNRAEILKQQIDMLPPAMLFEIEKFINRLHKKKRSEDSHTSLLSELAEYSVDDDLPDDLAEQHDHYLYGVPKK